MTTTRLSSLRLHDLANRITDSDYSLLVTVARLRLVTTQQLVRLHFAGVPSAERQARRRLAWLVQERLLARLERRIGGVRAGSAGYVFTLDVAGQRLIAQRQGAAVRRPWEPSERFMRHSLAVSELYVRLVEADRRGEVELVDFTTEPDCWRNFTGDGGGVALVKPDAYVRLAVGTDELVWFVEVDCATEGRAALQRQQDAYVRYWRSGREQVTQAVFPRVLWLVPNAKRGEVVESMGTRQPQDARALFQVAAYDEAVRVLGGGAP